MFDDVYFSRADGAAETEHVFLDGNNLPEAWQGRPRFTIAETGFGTGLNFLLAWDLFDRTAPAGAFLDFISIEKYPLTAEQIRRWLEPWKERLAPSLDKMLEQYPIRVPGFHRMVFDGRVALTLIFGDVNDVLPEITASVDAWFLDGFTPSKNPAMWTEELFGQMARLSHAGTSAATFTAAGFVKRGLRAAGFAVEKRKGFGTKRDMLAGRFAGEGAAPPVSTAPAAPAIGPAMAPPITASRTVHILGGGLAGCSAAYSLKQYGFTPVLYDPGGIAAYASGNPTGLVNPRFSAFRTAESDFYTAGYAQAIRSFARFSAIDYARCGGLHLITGEEKEKRLTRTAANWGWAVDHMRLVGAAEASSIAGVPLSHPALYLADAAQVSPQKLCHAYVRDVEVRRGVYAPVEGDIVLYANAAAAGSMFDLPVHTVRGQVTMVEANAISRKLKCNLSYGGYIAACRGGSHAIGATFQKWLEDNLARDEDDESNLRQLLENVPALSGPGFRITGRRASLRTASKDRFPIIGALDGEGHYISTAHGSHGLVSSLAGAHLLADIIRSGPFSLPASTVRALAASRFKRA